MIIHLLLFAIMLFALTLPPAAKVLVVIGGVYTVLQAIKNIPLLKPYIVGWVAILLNVLLSVGALFATVPSDQLYTQGTFNAIVSAIAIGLGAAGIHGTVKSLMPPTVLATTEDGKVKNVPATLQPVDPIANKKIDAKM